MVTSSLAQQDGVMDALPLLPSTCNDLKFRKVMANARMSEEYRRLMLNTRWDSRSIDSSDRPTFHSLDEVRQTSLNKQKLSIHSIHQPAHQSINPTPQYHSGWYKIRDKADEWHT